MNLKPPEADRLRLKQYIFETSDLYWVLKDCLMFLSKILDKLFW